MSYIDELDPRASDELRHTVNYLLHDYIVTSAGELFVACVNLAISNGVEIGIDQIRSIKPGVKP